MELWSLKAVSKKNVYPSVFEKLIEQLNINRKFVLVFGGSNTESTATNFKQRLT